MKKTFFLLSFFVLLCNVMRAEDCTVGQPVIIPSVSNEDRPFNQFPPTSSGDTYVGSAPLTLTFTTESNSFALLWTWYNQLAPDVVYTIAGNTSEITHTFDASGQYMVVVEAKDDGCEGVKDSVQVQVSTSRLEVPNVFSPNNDGQNELFCVAYESIVKYQCYVYNRWGRPVFSSNNPAICWDGRINGGKPADIGAYYYVIEAEGADGVRHKRGGDINLVR